MAESIPPVPPIPAPPAVVAPPPPVAEVPAPPPTLVLLPPGTRLDAVVAARLAPETFQVVTPQATFTVQTPLPLELGARLLLLLPERPALGFPVQVLTVNGRPVTAQAAAGLPTGNLPAGTAAAATAAPTGLTVGSTLLATVLVDPQQPGGRTPILATMPALAAGTAPATTAATLQPPGMAPAAFGALPTAPLSDVQAAAQVAARAVHDYARQAALSGPEGQRVILRVVGIGSPPAAGATPDPVPITAAPLTPRATVSGIVTGRLPQGFPVVQTPAGLLALTTLADIEPGTELTLRILAPAPTSAPQAALAGAPVDGEVAALRDWPALREAIAAMQTLSPPTARALAEVLPRFDATLTASVIFLLLSLRGGNLRDWLGETTVRDMQRLRPELVTRVTEDFSRFGVAANDPNTDWRSFMLPFLTGDALHPVRLFIHRHPQEEDAENDAGTRFVVDIALSRLGRFQIDGLVREKTRRFDLILRTATPLPPDIQNDIRNMFAVALEATGQTGGIAFRADPSDFVDPRPGGPAIPGVTV